MRTCQSCGRENPDDADFCSCGEYLRWEPTGFIQAVTPEMAQQAAADAAPAPAPPEPPAADTPPQVRQAEPAPPEPGNGHGNGAPPPRSTSPVKAAPPPPAPAPIPKTAKTLVRGAVPQPPAAPEQAEPATIVLRLPEGDPAKGETLHQQVEPGQRDRVLALVRNQSGIVDNYDLRVEGMPDDWWSIYPATVYLVPFGSGGTYEQEVEVHLHPPKSPQAEAKVWELRVVAQSKAQGREAAAAPLALHVLPYIEYATTLRPQRKKGRRKADFDVTVTNKANAPVLVALEGEDPDGELQFGFNRPPQEIPAGSAVRSSMRVRPPKLIWIGRPQDRRLEVKTITGEEAAERAAAEPLPADVLAQPHGFRRRGLLRRRVPDVPGVYAPRVYRPQLYPPDAQIGPGGIQLRMPKLQAPKLQGPQMKQVQLKPPANLKLPGRGGGSPAPAAALLPTQGVFRQRSFIPWWAVPLAIAIVALLLLLYKLSPQKVVVPQLKGQASAFKAEQKLTGAHLKLDPNQKKQLDAKVKPGTVINQTPAAGAKAKKGDTVAILVAVGASTVDVPDIVGMTQAKADQTLRLNHLTLGQAQPQPTDPTKEKIASQIPSAKEAVKQGTPVNIFYAKPKASPSATATKTPKGGKSGPGGGPGGPGGPGKGAAADIIVPAAGSAQLAAFANGLAGKGMVPVEAKRFSDVPKGKIIGTVPAGGTKVAKGAKVQVLVSLGEPNVVFSDGKNIRRINGATAKPLPNVAAGAQVEDHPTYNDVGDHIAYLAAGRILLLNLAKKNAIATGLTPTSDQYTSLAWAPTADVNVLAMAKVTNTDFSVNGATAKDQDLCLGQITKDPFQPQCFTETGFALQRAVHWYPNGKAILATAVRPDGSFGIVRWKLHSGKKPFSADPADYSSGHFVSDVSQKGIGAIDAALSPDGKKLAVVSNLGSSGFRLWIADDPTDFALSTAHRTPIPACKVAWRGDSQQLLVTQGSATCNSTEGLGALVRVDLSDIRVGKTLSPVADDPVYQPVSLGG
jgi:beta-lactam-binding protein with PASTA domain